MFPFLRGMHRNKAFVKQKAAHLKHSFNAKNQNKPLVIFEYSKRSSTHCNCPNLNDSDQLLCFYCLCVVHQIKESFLTSAGFHHNEVSYNSPYKKNSIGNLLTLNDVTLKYATTIALRDGRRLIMQCKEKTEKYKCILV